MKVLRSQSVRMNILQDESSLTKTSSEKDESDFMCPDSGLMTRACYVCEVKTNYGFNVGKCRLSVTAPLDLHVIKVGIVGAVTLTLSSSDLLYYLTFKLPLMEKMICRILLLITLTSCVCGTFVVNVTQSSYQAEENQNITLEWTFTIKKETPLTSLFI
ncbi:hypothetical protein L3Q82_003906 [Scortum barcoo]|uniref:Uncharacterized protein n=1 Tax=Scortum barcoo TaxID=214431 RepID=A0ACB8X9K2_9TELE|nr:hypothetical protein L3Q82_003906 [Scortum barcoo]